MAFESSALMKSLVSWASTHLAARDPSFEEAALRHRGSALNAVKASIEEGELSPEMCLAVSMVFCSMESISSREGAWYLHLLGGAAALGCNRDKTASRPDDAHGQSDSPPLPVRLSQVEGGWLLCNFAYHDVLMSVTLNCPPIISGQYWATSSDSGKADPYFGYASDIIHLISQTSDLGAKFAAATYPDCTKTQRSIRRVASVTKASTGLLIYHSLESSQLGEAASDSNRIESELLSWSCPDDAIGTPLHLLAEAYRGAALLHLYRTVRRYRPQFWHDIDSKIRCNVATICSLVSRMPEGCLAECTLLFPLFMAGGETDDPAEIEAIRDKMVMINRWRHFQNVDHALEVLDELWRLRSAGALGSNNRRLDWLDVTASQGIKLALT